MKKLLITFLSVLMLVACAIGIAACGKVEFKLSFIVDGEVYASIDTSGDEVITMPDEPKKEDYIFDGWYWDKDTWQRPFTANSLLNEPISSDMSVYAKWLEEDITKRSYTVSFNSFGGSAISDATVQYGKLLTEPSEPTRIGYVFVGWYKDADLKTEWNFAADTVTEDITLYAKWVDESDATGCDVLSADGFEVDGNTLFVKVPNAQEHFALSETITVSPYAEWTVTSDITGNTEIPSATVPLAVGNNTYYINVVSGNGSNKKQYTVEIRRRDIYTVTYSFGNGSADVTEQIEEDGKAPSKSADKTGYTFDCWKNGSSAWDFENDVVSGNTTLTASWSANTYDVIFNSNGGDTITASTATYDAAFEFTVPVRNGYTFSGWKTEGGTKLTDSTGKSIGVWNIAADTTLYADWSATEYSVVYNNMDGATNSNPIKYTVEDDTITLADAEKTGYAFLGWYSDSSMTSEVKQIDTSAAVNVELWAKWEAIEYTATFRNSDGVVDTVKFTVEDKTITEPKVPERNGYTGAWETYELTAGDLTINAVYTPVTYTITYTNTKDAENVNATQFTVESETIKLADLSVNGYTFNGWYNGSTKVTEIAQGSTGNITLTADWSAVVYTITYEGTKDVTNSNPTTYTIESATITLADISATGYTFNGWYNGSTKVTEIAQGSTGNITLTADWTAIQYNITYMYDAEIGDYPNANKNPATYTIEDNFDFIALVNKTTGYTFDGWYTEKNVGTGTKVTGIEAGTTGSITIYAHWALDEYEITYHNADGITNTNATTYTIETDTFSIYDVSKDGYMFNGWYSDSMFSNKVTEIAKGTTGNIDLYAKWTPIQYTIDYILYGGVYSNGSNPTNYTIENTMDFVAPELDGYTFVGFFTLAEGGELVTGIEKGTTGNKTFYARYIAFDTNGGTEIEYNFSIENNMISKPSEPQMEYYTFDGWYVDEALTQEFDFTIPSKTLTLYAKFVPTVYKITYILNGGTHPEGQVFEYTVSDTTVTLLNPTKAGYTFVGWFTDDKFTSSVVTELKNAHGDKTFYANYSINQYTISFETNGGTEVEAITQNYATSVSAPNAPAKNGYKFAGWYSDNAFKKEYSFTTMPAEDITVYAKWTIETYNITYNLEGGTNNKNNPSTFNVQSQDIILRVPTKAGYNFVGWYIDSDYTSAITKIATGSYGNIEVFAKWEIITYTITYVTSENTENINALTYTVETDLTNLADATLKGHTFGGWYKDGSYNERVYQFGGGEMGDITLYAKFTANTYDVWLDGTDEASFDVSFDLNGAAGSISKQTVTETNLLSYPTVPTRDGYVFGGWYSNSACEGNLYDFTALITGDTTLYAKWVKVENSITINTNRVVTLNGREEQKFTFIPLVSGNVIFTTTGNYDTLGILYDENGNILKMDDDTGSDGVNFQIVFNVTAGEVYTISVSSYSSATSGQATLYVSGDSNVLAGGHVIAGNKTQVTYGKDFVIPLPDAKDGYKFLGWADRYGEMYTDATGASVKSWDKDEITLLVSVWERTVYTITFDTGTGASTIAPVTLAYGERIDISKYVTTLSGKTFDCWLLDGVAFNATTMPDHNITLTAKWKTFSLGEIKYDETKLAISVNDGITADLFGAICIDTDGNKAEFTITVNGTQAAGETITVKLVAKSGNKTKQATITGIKVYGAPTLEFDDTVDYVNLVGGMTAEHFGASGIDTFGMSTNIKVYIEGNYEAGEEVTVTIEAIDSAGNATKGYVNNVKAYGLPEIAYNEDKNSISVNDTLSATLFSATAKDSFGNALDVTVAIYSGTINAGNNVTIRISTIDSKGNTTYIDVVCDVYGMPTISNATKAELKVDDTITPELLGITAKDTYGNALDVTLAVKSGTQTAGSTLVVVATATDAAKNTASKQFSIKVYGAPTITYDREGIKVGENAAINESTVVFDLNYTGATNAPAVQVITPYIGLVYPEIPMRDGYVFTGWYTTQTCETIFDFSSRIDQDITVYAGWYEIQTTGYGNYVLDVFNNNNQAEQSYSFSTSGTSSSKYRYTYFTALESGSYSIYFKNSSSSSNYGTYIYIYNVTQRKTIKSNSNITSTTYSSQTFTANAGDVIYIRNYRYNTNYSATFSMYFDVTAPKEGGVRETGAHSILNAIAKDSFGNEIDVFATIKSGDHSTGTHVVYQLMAVDHLGNIFSIETSPIGVYSESDIVLDYSYGLSDLIKLTSKGEEFATQATDSFGEFCDIELVPADGYEMKGGNVIAFYIVATDKAGNIKTSEIISDIKVYDMPTAKLTDESKGYTITEDGDVSFLFAVYDSFGEELYTEVTTEDLLIAGETIVVKVVAQDDAGNIYNKTFDIAVCSNEAPYVDLYIEGVLWKSHYATDMQSFDVPTDWRLPFIGWSDENGVLYTNANGELLKTLSSYTRLFATSDYTAIDTVEQLRKVKGDGKYILFADLNLNGESWTPIGTSANPFTGLFDGNSHRISNFTISRTTYNGLFGYNTGVIKNLQITSCTIQNSGGSAYYGLIAGYNGGTIENCTVSNSTLTNTYCAATGGLVGHNGTDGVIVNCKSYITVKGGGTQTNAKLYTGGLVGLNDGTIRQSAATGTVDGGVTGGLVGYNNGTIERSYATGAVTGEDYAGGLVGYMTGTGTVTNCYAKGSVSADTAGGLIGSNGGSVTYCYATGSVKAKGAIYGGTTQRVTRYAGGLIGRNSGKVTSCFATGNVEAYAEAGGATYCYATASAGGLIGSGSGTISSCYRASTQTISSTEKTPNEGTVDGTIKTEGTSSSLSSIISSVKRSWSSSYWNFSSSSSAPSLK